MALPRLGVPAWLGADLRWIMAGRAARSLAQGYLGVIIPLYLLRIGFTAVTLGELFTVGAVASALLTLTVSLLADQYGRKPFLVVFPLLTAAGALVFIGTRNVGLIMAASALGTLGRGGGAGGAGGGGPIYPAQQALIADHAGTARRNQVFTAFSLTDTLAATLGALLAGIPALLVARAGMAPADSYKPLFVLTSVLAVLSALCILPVRDAARRRRREGERRRLLPTQSRGVIARFALTNLVNGVGVGFFSPFIAYWFNRRYGEGPAEIGFLFAAVSLGAAVPYLFAPWLARTLGLVRAVVAIRLVGVASLAVLPFMPTFPLAAAVYFLRMALQRASIPLRQSYTMAVVAAAERSSAAGISNLPSQLSAAASPLLAGYLFQSVSMELPFEIGTSLQLANALLFWSLFRGIKPPEEAARTEAVRAATALASAEEPAVVPPAAAPLPPGRASP